ncbi:type II toxin-antitoxin system toxin DNA ADP-ribosyl transferase DarT [Actinoplanes flavus]|uniref:DUF4433 domain-containing protein n=1 Tax=Actinoplanes flavus TaxID=2820290 RepID=A0ABS3UE03_9ACTN|nr:DUF4433 domain-containing protein [Actinoplanes flavus]MBO3735978.1 DUF4433 domain-containing protein [Actinoplanes flavus]
MSPHEADRIRQRRIAHFTHIDNLPAIAASGRLSCDVTARVGLTRAEVGDPDIKELRRGRRVPTGPGGCVGDYVPFYFAPRSPMMYRIACDHRDHRPGRYNGGDRPLVYLVSTVGSVVDAGLTWVGTDGNAANGATVFTVDLPELDTLVDWPLMSAERWNNTGEDLDRQRRRMAEFLVHRAVPLTVFDQVTAYSPEYAERAREALADLSITKRVSVIPDWYYGYCSKEEGGGHR